MTAVRDVEFYTIKCHADAVPLTDNNDPTSHPLTRTDRNLDIYSIVLPALADGQTAIPHGSRVAVSTRTLFAVE